MSPYPDSIGELDSNGGGPTDAAEAGSLPIGGLFAGRYEIKALLGQGGMGTVYRVHDLTLREECALKVMHAHLLKRKRALDRFIQEARLSLRLQHPGIVRVRDIALSGVQHYLTMELLEGRTLRSWTEERKRDGERVRIEVAVAIVERVLDALAYAHEITIHRDIKPENLFLEGHEPHFRVKILDFGIAKALDAKVMSAGAAALGTAWYMAPEQRRSASAVDPRADLFSCGVVLYELLTGELPSGRFPLPSEVRHELDRSWDDFVLAAIDQKPERRPRTAREMAEGLRALVEARRRRAEAAATKRRAEEEAKRLEGQRRREEEARRRQEELARKLAEEAAAKRRAEERARAQEEERRREEEVARKLAEEAAARRRTEEESRRQEEERRRQEESRRRAEEDRRMKEAELARRRAEEERARREEAKRKTAAEAREAEEEASRRKRIRNFRLGVALVLVAAIAVSVAVHRGSVEAERQRHAAAEEAARQAQEAALAADARAQEAESKRNADADAAASRKVQAKGRSRSTRSVDGMPEIQIPAGRFRMGSDSGASDERPVHTVIISRPFYLDRHEVTVGQYRRVMGSVPGDQAWKDHPVVNVTWDEAAGYCARVGGRLPTEAEWEYSARGGLEGKKYPWGDDDVCLGGRCRANTSGLGDEDRFSGTAPVCSFPENGYGLCDMSGNAWEWVQDWYHENYYASSPVNDPQGPSSGTWRVVRGRSWNRTPGDLRSASRNWNYPGQRDVSFGFRCARDSK